MRTGHQKSILPMVIGMQLSSLASAVNQSPMSDVDRSSQSLGVQSSEARPEALSELDCSPAVTTHSHFSEAHSEPLREPECFPVAASPSQTFSDSLPGAPCLDPVVGPINVHPMTTRFKSGIFKPKVFATTLNRERAFNYT